MDQGDYTLCNTILKNTNLLTLNTSYKKATKYLIDLNTIIIAIHNKKNIQRNFIHVIQVTNISLSQKLSVAGFSIVLIVSQIQGSSVAAQCHGYSVLS